VPAVLPHKPLFDASDLDGAPSLSGRPLFFPHLLDFFFQGGNSLERVFILEQELETFMPLFLADKLYPFFLKQCTKFPCTLFVSATDMTQRAVTRHARAETPQEAWASAILTLEDVLRKAEMEPTILRADWVVRVEYTTWADFIARVEQTRRNYFRQGVVLDADWTLAFTEMELNANAMLYQAGDNPKGRLHPKNCAAYCKKRFGRKWPELSSDSPVTLFSTEGVFTERDSRPMSITGQGLEAGRRDIDALTSALFLGMAQNAARYLTRQVHTDGRFDYGRFSCFDKPIPTYNTLRHISTLWSMLEAYGAFKEKPLRDAIVRAVAYCVQAFARHHGNAIFFEDVESGECKLGSNGCALITLARYAELFSPKKYLPLMRGIARGILAMQEKDGGFVHVLHSADYTVKTRQRTVYYDGEAVYGLLRLYGLNKDAALLDAARCAFDHFIATDHWKHHDHWLSYAVNELTRYEPRREYFQFGIRNFNGYLDFVAERDTAFPTLLELMLAADAMLRRLEAMPEHSDLLAQVDRAKFTASLHSRARQLLNGYFWPEFAMFFKNPARIAGSFFIKHHAFRVRIDDVQHFLSGVIGYARFLDRKTSPTASSVNKTFPYYRIEFSEKALRVEANHCWGAEQLAAAANGVWYIAPPPQWYANAVISGMGYLSLVPAPAVFVATTAPHCAKHLRIKPKGIWDSHTILRQNWNKFTGAIVEHPVEGIPGTFPQLVVKDGMQALIEVGIAARKRFRGKVVGVTGSVGKTTTCDLLRYVLESSGRVFATYASHNNKIGVPSVFASIPATTDYAILEMSIPSFDMLGGSSSRYLNPHVAMVTQISEAHLDQWKTLKNVARMKSRILDGVLPGGYAVINSDMPWNEYFMQIAKDRSLQIITYGTHEKAMVRLLHVDAASMRFCYDGKERETTMSVFGKHAAMNSCGAIAVLLALGLDVDNHLERIASFRAVKGRGNILHAFIDGKDISVIDESYNASPASMKAALEAMALTRTDADVVLLGDMLSLGPDAPQYHLAIAESLAALRPSRVLLCGPQMKPLWEQISQEFEGRWFENEKEVCKDIAPWLCNGDRLLVKSSHGTGLWKFVESLTDGDDGKACS
jgi:UDP-N-acetylmuramoyl-tripeptide--D-alanyl-D-alanine ligase